MNYAIDYIASRYGKILKDSLAGEIDREIENLVWVGFDKPSEYRKSVWFNAKKMLMVACELGIAFEFDYGKGKGKYSSNLSIKEVVSLLQKNERAIEIALKSLRLDIEAFPNIHSNERFLELERA